MNKSSDDALKVRTDLSKSPIKLRPLVGAGPLQDADLVEADNVKEIL